MKKFVTRNVMAAASGPVEEDTVYEIALYIENDGNLYRQMIVPTIKNMQRKIKSGKYDDAQAVKAWQYVADEGVRRYGKEFGDGKSGVAWVNKNTRIAIAEELKDFYDDLVQDPDSISSATQITASSNHGKLYVLDDDACTCILLTDGSTWYEDICAPDGEFGGVDMYDGTPSDVAQKIAGLIKSGDIEDPDSILIDPTAYGFKKLSGVSSVDDIEGDVVPIKASKVLKKRSVKAASVIQNGLSGYTPWSGAKDTWDILKEFGKLDELESFIDDVYYDESRGEGVIGETELNDLLWFEPESVYEYVGLYYNPDTGEVSDEPFDDFDDDEY